MLFGSAAFALEETADGETVQNALDTASGPSVTESRPGVAVYVPAFFTDYSPVTALDMVRRVPGFSLSNGNTERRGLGDSFGNLLINGRRPSNKSLRLETVLQRIPKDDVAHIELIREALPEYDMRGHPRLVNVILREGAGSSGSWEVRSELSASNRLGGRGVLSYTMPVGDAEMTFGINAGYFGNRVRRRYSLLDGTGLPLEVARENDQRRFQEAIPTFSLAWPITDRTRLQLDTRGSAWSWHRTQVRFTDEPDTGAPLLYQQNATENHGSSWSATGSLQHEFSPSISTETILLASRERWDDGPEAYETYDPVAGFLGALIVEHEGEYEETAFRQTLSWDPNENHSWEFGAETALNARDTILALTEDDGVTLTPIDLPVSSTRVEETRSELFANHVWSLSENVNLETGLRYERSEIVQTGDANQTRTFNYAKPSVTLNWRLDDQNRLRFSGRRDVAQLNFGKFASNINVTDNNSTLGNPDYVPQQTWTVEAEWLRSFGEEGSLSLLVGYDQVKDLDGWIPVVTPDGVFDAPGNIGDGSNLRVTLNLTTPLDAIGLNNAVLDTFLERYDTRVDDPLTGESRVWSGPREWELRLDFRQSFPQRQLAWGWDYHMVTDGEVFRAQEYRRFSKTPGDLDVYVETTRWFDTTIRLAVDGIFNNGDDRERVFYDGSRALGVVDLVEHRNESRGTTWSLQVRGTF